MSDTLAAVRPDDEEYRLLTQELSGLKSRKHEARILLALADTKVGDKAESALSLRLKGTGRSVPQKAFLERDIETYDLAIGVLQGMYDDWQAREAAYHDASQPASTEENF